MLILIRFLGFDGFVTANEVGNSTNMKLWGNIKMNKHGFKLFVFIFLTFVVAVACSSNKQDDQRPNSAAPLSAAELLKAQEDIMNGTKLTLYHPSMTTEDFINIYGKSIVDKYPGIQIQVLNAKDGDLDDMILTGTNIDIIGGLGGAYATRMKEMGITSDLSNFMKKYNYDLSAWDPVVVKFIEEFNGGEITSIPHTIQTQALFYNKNLFSKFGVTFPKDGLTWDDVQELNRRLTREDGGVMYWGYDTSYAPNMFTFNQLSIPLIDTVTNRAAFETDAMKSYMSKMISVVTSHGLGVFSGPGSVMDLFLKEQRLAMISMNNTGFRSLNSDSLDWDITKFPVFPELPGVGGQPEIPMYFVPGNSKNLEAAFLALAAITSPEAQRELAAHGRVSILKDPAMISAFGNHFPELQGKNKDALIPDQYAEVTTHNEYKGIAAIELNEAYVAVITGTKDLNTAMRDAVESLNKKIDEMEELNK